MNRPLTCPTVYISKGDQVSSLIRNCTSTTPSVKPLYRPHLTRRRGINWGPSYSYARWSWNLCRKPLMDWVTFFPCDEWLCISVLVLCVQLPLQEVQDCGLNSFTVVRRPLVSLLIECKKCGLWEKLNGLRFPIDQNVGAPFAKSASIFECIPTFVRTRSSWTGL